MRLTSDKREKRREVLKDLYDKGYRYITASRNDQLIAGISYNKKIEAFGVWGMEDPISLKAEGIDRGLFPDVQWENDKPLLIEDELVIA